MAPMWISVADTPVVVFPERGGRVLPVLPDAPVAVVVAVADFAAPAVVVADVLDFLLLLHAATSVAAAPAATSALMVERTLPSSGVRNPYRPGCGCTAGPDRA